VTDPNLVYDLRAKLDAEGHYDDNDMERVVKAELNPKREPGSTNWPLPSLRLPTSC
jgi:type I restriction enzyme R subunit